MGIVKYKKIIGFILIIHTLMLHLFIFTSCGVAANNTGSTNVISAEIEDAGLENNKVDSSELIATMQTTETATNVSSINATAADATATTTTPVTETATTSSVAATATAAETTATSATTTTMTAAETTATVENTTTTATAEITTTAIAMTEAATTVEAAEASTTVPAATTEAVATTPAVTTEVVVTTDDAATAPAAAAAALNAGEIYAKLSNAVALPEMFAVPDDVIPDFYAIFPEQYNDAVFMMCADSLKADEIVIVRAIDENASKRIDELLKLRLSDKADAARVYSPEQYAIINNCTVIQDGLWVAMIVSPDESQLVGIFKDAIE